MEPNNENLPEDFHSEEFNAWIDQQELYSGEQELPEDFKF
jgi:hypothetical protein